MTHHFAVPMIVLVQAENPEDAMARISNINAPYNARGEATFLFDEHLAIFAYNEDREIHSALDYDECAIRELSEPKKEQP
jgi:hypothetical protein